MTGWDLLEGLSFVDAGLIEEAESARLRRGTPWMKWVSAAACLCILVLSVVAYREVLRPKYSESTSEMAMAEAPQAAPDLAESTNEEWTPETGEVPAEGQIIIPSVTLRVTELRENGFEALVVENEEDSPKTGTRVLVVVAADSDAPDLNIGPDALLVAENSTYDPDTKTLYVSELSPKKTP